MREERASRSSVPVVRGGPSGVSSAMRRPRASAAAARSARLVHHVAGDQHASTPSVGQSWNRLHRSRRSTGSRPTVGSSRTSSCGSPSSATARLRPGALAAGQAVRPGGRRERSRSTAVDHPVDVAARGAEHPGEEAQVLGDGQVRVHAGRLGDVADQTRSSGAGRAAQHLHRARRRPSGRPTIDRISVVLPQPDGPSSPVTLPRRHREAHVIEHDPAAADDPQRTDRDGYHRLFIM